MILPMTVLRRLDAVLEPTKQAVLAMKASLDKSAIVHQDAPLRQAAGQAFYNTSKFTLRDLRARSSQQQLKADFEAYLDGFSPNVQDILENLEFRNQIPRLSKADALGTLIEKFLDSSINVGPSPVLNTDGSVKHPGLDNHAMGKIFEELVRRFKPLRKNLGKKSCELAEDDIQRICDTFLAFKETEQSKDFPNAAFGHWKVTVERPLRLTGIDPDRV